jgi:hypothetical protein
MACDLGTQEAAHDFMLCSHLGKAETLSFQISAPFGLRAAAANSSRCLQLVEQIRLYSNEVGKSFAFSPEKQLS